MDEKTRCLQNSVDSRQGTHNLQSSSHYGSTEQHTDLPETDDGLTHSSHDPLINADLRPVVGVAIVEPERKYQSSFITIFSIWNTMVGTSFLCVPWAINKSGFGCGVVLLVLMALITMYTAYLIVKCHQNLGLPHDTDFTDVCRHHFGRIGSFLSLSLSLLSLTAAAIVYWILMSNFLFYAVDFVYELANHEFKNVSNSTYNDVVCFPPNETSPSLEHLFKRLTHTLSSQEAFQNDSDHSTSDQIYHTFWNLHTTTPLFLIIIIFPLISLKSPTFFTKFTALGTISIVYLLFFVTYKASMWGIHLTFDDPSMPSYSSNFQWTFPTLSGMLSLAYFIHNAILAILSHQRKPCNNTRDLTIAYLLVMFTFCYIGLLFFASFPLAKHCIADNLLNNFINSDPWAFVCRGFLLLQMTTTLPLLLFILKTQLLKCLFNSSQPGTLHIFVSNVVIVTSCVLFAVFYPQVGNIIRYFGSTCGLGYIFTLPPLISMIQLRQRNQLTLPTLLFHSLLIFVGVANFVAQFLI